VIADLIDREEALPIEKEEERRTNEKAVFFFWIEVNKSWKFGGY
jgi:hypothetical protein